MAKDGRTNVKKFSSKQHRGLSRFRKVQEAPKKYDRTQLKNKKELENIKEEAKFSNNEIAYLWMQYQDPKLTFFCKS